MNLGRPSIKSLIAKSSDNASLSDSSTNLHENCCLIANTLEPGQKYTDVNITHRRDSAIKIIETTPNYGKVIV